MHPLLLRLPYMVREWLEDQWRLAGKRGGGTSVDVCWGLCLLEWKGQSKKCRPLILASPGGVHTDRVAWALETQDSRTFCP